MYQSWSAKVTEAFRAPAKCERNERLDKHTFPWLPPEVCACEELSCLIRKREKELGACIHDVETLLKSAREECVLVLASFVFWNKTT
jgi:hypothetical protein